MARPRQFDEEKSLEDAMMVFWRHGYHATTFKMLEASTGVGAKGLTNVLGDKDTIFEKVLRLYYQRAQTALSHMFEVPSLDAIKAFLKTLSAKAKSEDAISNAGCLMVSTIYEVDQVSPEAREALDDFRNLLLNTFRTALEAEGIDDANEKAEFVLGILWAGHNQIRLRRRSEAAAAIVRVGLETIESWRLARPNSSQTGNSTRH